MFLLNEHETGTDQGGSSEQSVRRLFGVGVLKQGRIEVPSEMSKRTKVVIDQWKRNRKLGARGDEETRRSDGLHHGKRRTASPDQLNRSEPCSSNSQGASSHSVCDRRQGCYGESINRHMRTNGTTSLLHASVVVLKIERNRELVHNS